MGAEEAYWGSTGLSPFVPFALRNPSAVSRLCREGLLGPRPHPASGMVRWKVGSLESELWSRGFGRRVPDSDPGLNGTGIGIGSYCFFLSVSYAGSEIEGGEGC